MTKLRRFTPYLSAVALKTSLAGCGGSSNTPSTPTPTPTPTPPPPQVVSQITGAALPAGFFGGLPFTTTRAGALDATVDWTFTTNNVDVYIGQGSCDENTFATATCPVLAFSESPTAKPERVHLANAAAGTYTTVVANFGPTDESISFQVVLTPSATGAVPPTASSRTSEGLPLRLKTSPRGWVELK